MFIPLYDTNHLRTIRLQYVTIVLIVLNVAAYLATTIGGEDFSNAAVLGLSFIPSVVNHTAELAPQFVIIPENLSYLTYAFLHADIFHLGGNMLFLWVFGDNVEDALGHYRYLLFYVACAIGGAAFHSLIAPDSQAPLIGASGAVAGVVVAYLILYPKVKIWILAFGRIPLRIPAYIPLALWILVQFTMFAMGGEDQISWACHIGGILSGAVLVLLLKRRDVPLSDEAMLSPLPGKAPPRKIPETVEGQPQSPWNRS